MTKKTVQTLSEQFVTTEVEIYDVLKNGDSKSLDDSLVKIRDIYCQLRDNGDEGVAALKRLTQHTNMLVRSRAAAYFVWIDLPYAMGVLEEVSERWSKYPPHTMESSASGSARVVYSVIARRGAPLFPDPYIKWKEKQQAKEQK